MLLSEAKKVLKSVGYRVINEREINLNYLLKDIFELLTSFGISATDDEVEKLMWTYINSGRKPENATAEDILEFDIDNDPDTIINYTGDFVDWIKRGQYKTGPVDESVKMNESIEDKIANKIYEIAEEFGHGVYEKGNGYLIYNDNIAVEDDDEFQDKLEKELGSTIGYDGDGDGNLFVWIEEVVESTQMNEDINNPDEPATKKQLWALFCIYKKDFRDQGLTKGEAAEMISKAQEEKPYVKTSGKNLDKQICEDIETNLKPKLDNAMKQAFGMKAVVGDADLEGNLIPGGKRYKFFGSGCGFAWVKYDKRNKKLGEVLDKYIDTYHDKYFEKYADEYIKKYEERELGGVLSQDIHIQSIINQAALDFAKKIGINTKGAYVQSRLD